MKEHLSFDQLVDHLGVINTHPTFGGVFIGDEGETVHVKVLRGEKDTIFFPDDDRIVFDEVKYTKREVMNAQTALRPYWNELGIQGVYKDYRTNELVLQFLKPDINIKKLKNVIENSEIFRIEEIDTPHIAPIAKTVLPQSRETNSSGDSTQSDLSISLRDGEMIGMMYSGTITYNMSLTCGLLLHDTNERAFLTTGHSPAWQKYFYGVKDDEITRVSLGFCNNISNTNQWDFAVVKRTNTDAHMAGMSIDGTQCAGTARSVQLGLSVWMNGYISRSGSGVVTDDSAEFQYTLDDGRVMNMIDMIMTDIPIERGDSGGPLFCKIGNYNYLLGNVVARAGNVASAYGKIWKILDHINASMYKF